jgi:ribosome-binding factor A
MNQERLKKLESVTRQLVSSYIFEEMGEDALEFGLINITDIKISNDLSYLDIFVSSFQNQDMLTKALAKHASAVQRKFNKAVSIRKLPKIRFRYDDSGATGQKINETINSLDINE